MRKQFKLIMVALLLAGTVASCSQSDVEDLTLEDAKSENFEDSMGGGHGSSGPKGGD